MFVCIISNHNVREPDLVDNHLLGCRRLFRRSYGACRRAGRWRRLAPFLASVGQDRLLPANARECEQSRSDQSP